VGVSRDFDISVSNDCFKNIIEFLGSHRSWDFDGEDFVFTKDKQLYCLRNVLGSKVPKTIRCKGHDRVINCATSLQLNESSRRFLITGGEDTLMQIWHVKDNDIIPVHAIRSHISSIKCISNSITKKSSELILVTAGGRAQIKVWSIAKNNRNTDNELPPIVEVASHMLKGNDKHRQKTWKSEDLIDDAETRYMSVQIRMFDNDSMILAAACSDGVIRTFRLGQDKKIILMSETDELHNAILQTAFLNENAILTADTIGSLVIRNAKTLDHVSTLPQVHQSGINSMILFGDHLTVSGGDDGTITIADLQTNSKICQKIGAHSAHVTGLVKLDNSHFASCSVDQRITIWKFNDNKTIENFKQVFSYVPDIQAMTAWVNDLDQSFTIVVFGEGIESFNVTL